MWVLLASQVCSIFETDLNAQLIEMMRSKNIFKDDFAWKIVQFDHLTVYNKIIGPLKGDHHKKRKTHKEIWSRFKLDPITLVSKMSSRIVKDILHCTFTFLENCTRIETLCLRSETFQLAFLSPLKYYVDETKCPESLETKQTRGKLNYPLTRSSKNSQFAVKWLVSII